MLTAEGLVTIPGGSAKGEGFRLETDDDAYSYYMLPNGVVLVADLDGNILSVTAPGAEAAYHVDRISFERDAEGKLTAIVFTDTDTGAYALRISYDAQGKPVLAIGQNGATLYVEQDSALGWTLPNGVRIYYKNAFLLDGEVITGLLIGKTSAGNLLLLLEEFDPLRTVYHVAEMDAYGNFVEGYRYSLSEIAAALQKTELTKKMEGTEAFDAMDGALGDAAVTNYMKAADWTSTDGLKAYLAGILESVLTDNFGVELEISFTTERVTILGEEDEPDTYEYLLKSVAIQAVLSENSVAGGFARTGNYSYQLDLSVTQGVYDVLSGTNSGVDTGINAGGRAPLTVSGYDLDDAVSGNPDVKTMVYEKGEGYAVMHGVASFDLAAVEPGGNTYRVKALTAQEQAALDAYDLARYNELDGFLFIFEEDAASTTLRVLGGLTEEGAGEMTATEDNGGYVRTGGAVLFLDEYADLSQGVDGNIFYLEDSAVAVLPDGRIMQLAIEGNVIGEDGVESQTIFFSPHMVQKVDDFGNPVFARLLFEYYILEGASFVRKTLYATDEEDALARIRALGEEPIGMQAVYNGYTGYEYDRNSAPIYELLAQKPGSVPGTYVYQVYDRWTRNYLYDGEYTPDYVRGNAYWNYVYEPVFDYLPETVILRPAVVRDNQGNLTEIKGAEVTFLGPADGLDIVLDKQGYGIISEFVRVYLEDDPAMPFSYGSILFLDALGQICAWYTPEGIFRLYDAGSALGVGSEAYSEYKPDGQGDLDLRFSGEAQIMLHEVMGRTAGEISGGIYMIPLDSEGSPGGSLYLDNIYFGYDAYGDLRQLETLRFEAYQSTSEEDRAFDGSPYIAICEAGRTLPALLIIEALDGRTVFLFTRDGTWIDNEGNTGSVPGLLVRDTFVYTDATEIDVRQILAEEVRFTVSGGETQVTDNGAVSGAHITADTLILTANDQVAFFREDRPMRVTPFSGPAQTMKLTIQKDLQGGAFNGSAYISLLEGSLDLQDLGVAEDGRVGLTVESGSAETGELAIAGVFSLDAAGRILIKGDALIDGEAYLTAGGDVESGKLEVGADGMLAIDAGGNIWLRGDALIDGEAYLTAGGDVESGKLEVGADGILAIDADGSIWLRGDALIDGEADLTAGGDVESGKLEVGAGGILVIDADGKIWIIGDAWIAGSAYLRAGGETALGATLVDGLLIVEAAGDIRMLDPSSILVISGSASSSTSLRAGGDIGSPELYFRLDVAEGHILNIIEAANIYLRQDLGESIYFEGRDENGRIVGGIIAGNVVREAIAILLDEMAPDRVTAQLLQGLASGTLLQTQLLELMDGVLTGFAVLAILGVDDNAYIDARIDVDALIEALEGLTPDALVAEALSLGLALTGEETAEELVDLILGFRREAERVALRRLWAADDLRDPYGALGLDGAGGMDEEALLYGMLVESFASGRIEDGKFFSLFIASLSDEQRAEHIAAVWEDVLYPDPALYAQRTLEVAIGSSSGKVYAENKGDILISVERGDLRVGRIASDQGDVALTAKEGGILGIAAPIDASYEIYNGARSRDANVYGGHMTLEARDAIDLAIEQRTRPIAVVGNINEDVDENGAAYSWVMERDPDTGGLSIVITVDFRPVIDLDLTAPTSLIARSGEATVAIRELTGSLGVRDVLAVDSVTLYADGDIVNSIDGLIHGNAERVRAKAVALYAGGSIGKGDDPIILYTDGGTLSAGSGSDIFIIDVSDGILVSRIVAPGDVVLTSGGGILDNLADLVAAAIEAARKQAMLDSEWQLALERAAIYGAYADQIEEILGREAALAILVKAAEAVEDALADLEESYGLSLADRRDAEEALRLALDELDKHGQDVLDGEATIQGMLDRIREITGEIETLLADIQGLEQGIAEGEAAIPGMEADVADLEAAIRFIEDDILAMETALADLDESDEEDKEEIRRLTEAISLLQGELDANTEALIALRAALAEAQQELAAMGDGLVLRQRDIAALEEEDADLREGVAGESEGIDALVEAIELLARQIEALEEILALCSEKESAQDELDAIDAEIERVKQQHQDMLAEAERLGQETLSALSDAAAAKAAIQGSAIEAGGDLHLQVGENDEIGAQDNRLSVLVGGLLLINEAKGGRVRGLYLESTGDIILGSPVEAGEGADLYAQGGIRGAEGLAGNVLTTGRAGLHALQGDVGLASRPLRISVDTLSATGAGVYIVNDKSLQADTIIGDTVHLQVDGDLSGSNAGGGGSDIYAGDLTLNASGNIGKEDARLGVSADSFTSRSRNLYLLNNNARLRIRGITVDEAADIVARGSVSGGVIVAGEEIKVDAYGNVGNSESDPLIVNTPGTVEALSAYGMVYLRNLYTEDPIPPGPWPQPPYGGGGGGGGFTIIDSPVPTGICSACTFLTSVMARGMGLALHDARRADGFTGERVVTIALPADADLEGKTVKVLFCVDDKIRIVSVVVKDGNVTIPVEGKVEYFLVIEDEVQIKAGYPQPFTDINSANWFYADVVYAYQTGMLRGIAANLFAPNMLMTREMFVTILHRLEGAPSFTGPSAFSDVGEGDWYFETVNWAASVGLVVGMGDGTFGAGATITREQMAAMLYRYARYRGADTGIRGDLGAYADAGLVSAWAEDVMRWAVGAKMIAGTSADTLDPLGGATRAQAAVIMGRFTQAFGPKMLVVPADLLER
ncbi:MAG: S-layer homology domain-containing protein [Clostridiales bacterium]|nr:S-layer homology domain-containing protein [Clostridiales bacterium]